MRADSFTSIVMAAAIVLFAGPSRGAASDRVEAAIDDVEVGLAFEANHGQSDRRARFVARPRGAAVFVTPGAIAVALERRGQPKGLALEMRFEGARATASVEGERRLPGVANYLRGNDPSRWRTEVPTYAAVRVRELYAGVDLVCYGNGADLEYDFVVAPGADPGAVRTTFAGATGLRVDASTGDLVVETALGELRQQAPAAYQEAASGRRAVAVRYVVRGGTVGIETGAYDRALPLVVDPTLRYSTYLGGTLAEELTSVAVDAAGSAYVAGNTFSTNYPTTPGVFQIDQGDDDDDVVVTKLSASGSTPVYSTYIGGDLGDFCSGIDIDASGNAYLVGTTFSTTFPTTNAFQGNQAGGDAFVAKLNATGTGLLYSTYLGGTLEDAGRAIDADATGSAYVTGTTASAAFPTTASAYQSMLVGAATTPFVSRIDTVAVGAASLVYSTYLGDAGQGRGIATDGAGRAYVTGQADGTAFPTTAGALQTNQPGVDGFVSKLDTGVAGAAGLVYSTYLGGGAEDICFGLALDAAGTANVTGQTLSTNFPTTAGGFQPAPPSVATFDYDAFVVKLNATGTGLVYGSYLGGMGDDQAFGIAVDTVGGMYVVGETFSSDFPTTPGPLHGDMPDSDVFVSRLTADRIGAASLVSSTYLGGNSFETPNDIAVNQTGEAYVVGFTGSTDYPTLNPFQLDQGAIDAFVTKVALDAGKTGSDTAGIYVASAGAFFLKNTNAAGSADVVFTFGASNQGYVALAGDWDGNGMTTVGLYLPSTGVFFLKNTNAGGAADLTFQFGAGGMGLIPLVGDWDGDGDDTIGIYAPSTGAFFLKNTNAGGAADIVFNFGPGGVSFVPVTGDWDGDGDDTVGIYDMGSGAWFLRNAPAGGFADLVFFYGPAGATPLAGDFDNDGIESVGIYIPSSAAWFLRNSSSGGVADLVFNYGPSNATPLVGDWDGS